MERFFPVPVRREADEPGCTLINSHGDNSAIPVIRSEKGGLYCAFSGGSSSFSVLTTFTSFGHSRANEPFISFSARFFISK